MALDDIRIVLVEAAHPGNIGAVARAMNTMSLTRLVLVRPRVFPSEEADRRAMGSIDILRQARVVDDLDQAVGDCRLVIGCSARARSFPHTLLDARECGVRVVAEASAAEPAAVVFGPERTGLANQDLDRCTLQVRIPSSEAFSSLNLASAVQLICYEIFMADRAATRVDEGAVAAANGESRDEGTGAAPGKDSPSTHQEMEYFYDHLQRALDSRGYLGGQMREITMMKLRRLFGRSRPNEGELKMLRTLMRLIHRDGE